MSGERAWTPAPWRVVEYGDGDSLAVHDARGDWRVCFMATPGKAGDFEGIAANARLIAAAPELFEACEGMIPANVCLTNRNVRDDTVLSLDVTMGELRKVAAALAKARGDS